MKKKINYRPLFRKPDENIRASDLSKSHQIDLSYKKENVDLFVNETIDHIKKSREVNNILLSKSNILIDFAIRRIATDKLGNERAVFIPNVTATQKNYLDFLVGPNNYKIINKDGVVGVLISESRIKCISRLASSSVNRELSESEINELLAENIRKTQALESDFKVITARDITPVFLLILIDFIFHSMISIILDTISYYLRCVTQLNYVNISWSCKVVNIDICSMVANFLNSVINNLIIAPINYIFMTIGNALANLSYMFHCMISDVISKIIYPIFHINSRPNPDTGVDHGMEYKVYNYAIYKVIIYLATNRLGCEDKITLNIGCNGDGNRVYVAGVSPSNGFEITAGKKFSECLSKALNNATNYAIGLDKNIICGDPADEEVFMTTGKAILAINVARNFMNATIHYASNSPEWKAVLGAVLARKKLIENGSLLKTFDIVLSDTSKLEQFSSLPEDDIRKRLYEYMKGMDELVSTIDKISVLIDSFITDLIIPILEAILITACCIGVVVIALAGIMRLFVKSGLFLKFNPEDFYANLELQDKMISFILQVMGLLNLTDLSELYKKKFITTSSGESLSLSDIIDVIEKFLLNLKAQNMTIKFDILNLPLASMINDIKSGVLALFSFVVNLLPGIINAPIMLIKKIPEFDLYLKNKCFQGEILLDLLDGVSLEMIAELNMKIKNMILEDLPPFIKDYKATVMIGSDTRWNKFIDIFLKVINNVKKRISISDDCFKNKDEVDMYLKDIYSQTGQSIDEFIKTYEEVVGENPSNNMSVTDFIKPIFKNNSLDYAIINPVESSYINALASILNPEAPDVKKDELIGYINAIKVRYKGISKIAEKNFDNINMFDKYFDIYSKYKTDFESSGISKNIAYAMFIDEVKKSIGLSSFDEIRNSILEILDISK